MTKLTLAKTHHQHVKKAECFHVTRKIEIEIQAFRIRRPISKFGFLIIKQG